MYKITDTYTVNVKIFKKGHKTFFLYLFIISC